MSVLDLSVAKDFLDVIHGADDVKLQMLLDGAEDEAAQYMGFESMVEMKGSDGQLSGSIVLGVLLLLQAVYQATPEDAEILRRAAEVKLAPYRIRWGA